MTAAEPREPEVQVKSKRTRKVDPPSDSKLATLLTEYAKAKEQAEAYSKQAGELQSQIRQLLFDQAGDDVPDSFSIPADPHGGYPAFSMYYTPPSWSLDSKSLKSNDPETWVQYAKEKRGYWTFKERENGIGRRKHR